MLCLLAVGVVLFVFSSTDKRVPVLQAVHDLPAGSQLTPSDFRAVELTVDPSVAAVPAADIATVVGQYTKVRIVSGGLVSAAMLQPAPLVAPGAAVVAVMVPNGELPTGLRERSQVQLVMPSQGDEPASPPVTGRVVGLPQAPDSTTGQLSISVELASADALTVAGARSVRVVLIDPGVDPAAATS
jgi:hypothetical protein